MHVIERARDLYLIIGPLFNYCSYYHEQKTLSVQSVLSVVIYIIHYTNHHCSP